MPEGVARKGQRTKAMFEVILTFRPDFAEQVVGRYGTEEEAQAVAERLSAQRPERVIRVWVRRVREAGTTN
jgi:hypothetical protein